MTFSKGTSFNIGFLYSTRCSKCLPKRGLDDQHKFVCTPLMTGGEAWLTMALIIRQGRGQLAALFLKQILIFTSFTSEKNLDLHGMYTLQRLFYTTNYSCVGPQVKLLTRKKEYKILAFLAHLKHRNPAVWTAPRFSSKTEF